MSTTRTTYKKWSAKIQPYLDGLIQKGPGITSRERAIGTRICVPGNLKFENRHANGSTLRLYIGEWRGETVAVHFEHLPRCQLMAPVFDPGYYTLTFLYVSPRFLENVRPTAWERLIEDEDEEPA